MCNAHIVHMCFRGRNRKIQKAARTCFATRLVNNNEVTINAFNRVTIVGRCDTVAKFRDKSSDVREPRSRGRKLFDVGHLSLKHY